MVNIEETLAEADSELMNIPSGLMCLKHDQSPPKTFPQPLPQPVR